MGGCAGCVGPNRRAEKYKVNRLTQDSPIKNSVTPSELPIRRYTERVIQELNQSKKRIDHNNNLINPLLSSLGMLNDGPGLKGKTSSSALYSREQPTKMETFMTSSGYNYVNKKADSKYSNENYIKEENTKSIFDRSFIESRIVKDGKGVHTSQFKTSASPPHDRDSFHYKDTTSAIYKLGRSQRESNQPFSFNYQDSSADLFKVGAGVPPLQSRDSAGGYKEPLKEVFNNSVSSSKGPPLDRSKHFKSNRLLNIPELPQQQARTPQYVDELRRQNGEDVKRTGLQIVPKYIEAVPKANLHKYLKDLQ